MTRILYVEDNEDNVFMLTARLRRKGYEVLVARDGEEGIALASSAAPDLILMDLSLPVLDGWEAIRRLKADPRLRKIPIIALTAHAMPGDRERTLAAGADDYDSKPVRLAGLLGRIEALLEAGAKSAGGPVAKEEGTGAAPSDSR